jgi:hypothetical protein
MHHAIGLIVRCERLKVFGTSPEPCPLCTGGDLLGDLQRMQALLHVVRQPKPRQTIGDFDLNCGSHVMITLDRSVVSQCRDRS